METLSFKSLGEAGSRSYIVYEVYGGSLSLGDFAALLDLSKGVYIYYGFDGYTYLIILPKAEAGYLDIDIVVGEALEADGLEEDVSVVGVFEGDQGGVLQLIRRRCLGEIWAPYCWLERLSQSHT